MQRLLSSLPKIGPTILLVTILGGGFLLGLTGSTSATFHGPPMNRAKPEKRFSPIDEARLGELQCEGRQRALFQGVCHEVTRGSWSLDEVTNVLSISTIDSSGVAELQVVFKQPGRFQAVGGLRHSILDSALARSSGAILDWLTVGEFTETRGGTELGVQSGQGSMQFNMNFEELQIWSEIQPLNSASCDREAQVWDQGTFVGSFAHSCGEPVRTPAGVGLQGLAFSRMRSGAMSTSANLIAYHGFFDASTPFAIPTPDGFETAVGDELRIVFRLPEGKSFWLEGEELSIFSGRPFRPQEHLFFP